ncbi:MAG: hypothetical protein Q9166_002225 [cf. Caloplaca sp. 2 TL-2023]
MLFRSFFTTIPFFLKNSVFASPLHQDVQALEARYNVPAPSICKAVTAVVSALSLNKATPFCQSFLHIPIQTVTSARTSTKVATVTVDVGFTNVQTVTSVPTSTATVTVTVASVVTATSTTGVNSTVTSIVTIPSTVTITTNNSVSTSIVFRPGNPPTKVKDRREIKADQDNTPKQLEARRAPKNPPPPQNPPIPSWVKAYPTPLISTACSCLGLKTPTNTIGSVQTVVNTQVVGRTSTVVAKTTVAGQASTTTKTVTVFATSTVTVSTTQLYLFTSTITQTDMATATVAGGPIFQTVYPCAAPLPSPGPAYGDSYSPNSLGLQNNLYYLNTPQGSSASACCNTCFFEVPNCIQAYFYFYQGCVVSQATDLSSGSGQGISATCPVGTFNGLSYGPDVIPAFRSTGDIAGPCGQKYTNV